MTTTQPDIRQRSTRAAVAAARRADRHRSAAQRLASALRAGEADLVRGRMRDQLVTSLQRLGQWRRYQDRHDLGEVLARAITAEHDEMHAPGAMRWCQARSCRVLAREK